MTDEEITFSIKMDQLDKLDSLLKSVENIEAIARERFLNNVEFKYVDENLVTDNIVTIPLNETELKNMKRLYHLLNWQWKD